MQDNIACRTPDTRLVLFLIRGRTPDAGQFGLLDVPNVSDLDLNGEDDAALEAELLAITGGDKRLNKKAKKIVAPEILDQMVAECMKDDSEEEASDIDDPDLLAELNALGSEEEDVEENSLTSPDSSSITDSRSDTSLLEPGLVIPNVVQRSTRPIPAIIRPSPLVAGSSVLDLLTERIAMYEEAIKNANDSEEIARSKRFSRGLATLNKMMKSLKAGNAINEEDIPPAVLTKTSRANSSQDLSEHNTENCPPENRISSAKSIPQTVIFDNNVEEQPMHISKNHSIIIQRQMEFKMAALNSKKLGDQEMALNYFRIVKQLAPMIEAASQGQEVDINSIPCLSGVTSTIQGIGLHNLIKESSENAHMPCMEQEVLVQNTDGVKEPDKPTSIIDNNDTSTAPSIPAPSSILEALEQRLDKYTQQRDKAKIEEDSRKERMNTRIMKQYQDAIKAHKAGKSVAFDELPTPPGFPALPIGEFQATIISAPKNAPSVPPSTDASEAALPKVQRPAPAIPVSTVSSAVKPNVRKTPQSRVERQLSVLQKRQDLFKEAALESKKRGEIEQAKEYLRNFKGFDQLIMATNSGLPVDMNTVPVPPQEQLSSFNTSLDFEIINTEDCVVSPASTPADIALAYSKLEEDLISQIKMCAHTREHFKALGDVASSNRFEHLIINTKKDLDAVRVALKRGDNPPRFHYESRSFTIIQCNTDLNDSDCEVTIMRGINYNVPNPKEFSSYVKLEFPYPSETPPQEKTEIVKESNSPEYNHKVVFSIDRKARALSRVFKRHSVKCQIVAKGSWFHRDTIIGTAKVPLVSLETKCTMHDSFDLYDEKKKMVGGKLEVKIRVRNPIISKQLEKVNEKWVVIDGF